MLDYMEFKNEEFDQTQNLLGGQLTNNTIILCNSYETMNYLHSKIVDTVNEITEEDGIEYFCEDEDVLNAKTTLCFGLQRVIQINNQTITLALEPSIIYKAESIEDIWFADKLGDKYSVYSMDRFIGCQDKWNEGKDAVYRYIVNGRYGCYDGKWTNLNNGGVKIIDGKLVGNKELNRLL